MLSSGLLRDITQTAVAVAIILLAPCAIEKSMSLLPQIQ